MWQGQTWVTRKETLLLLVCGIIITSLIYLQIHMHPHVTGWLTKPSQLPWTDNESFCQVVYISVFCFHTLLRLQRVSLFFMRLNMSRCTKKIKWLWRSMLNIFLKWSTYIVCTPFLLRVESPIKLSKKEAWQDLKF